MAQTEVRLGLVMYGGVSLAVYINGVTHEFFRAVRRKGIYDLVAKLTDSKVVVDIISGTSAGGINGIFLGYALANNKDFGDMANLWRELGDISQLLQKPNGNEPKSLLDSRGFYHSSLIKAFERMNRLPNGEDLQVDEMDLFVTGTNVDGNIYTNFDEMGHPIDVKDHRTVFVLKHRKGRKEPFDPHNKRYYANPEVAYQALSKLARITSCFPAAFEPVDVADIEAPPRNHAYRQADQCLAYWGDVRQKSYFMDGGILDNKPFSYTIDAIFSRNADTDVERFLCYVEPDPERFKQHDSTAPSFVDATIKGGLTITSYESIADDLESIRAHNSRVQQYSRLCSTLKGRVGNRRGVVPPATNTSASDSVYARCRFDALAGRAIEGVLKHKGERQYLRDSNQRNRATELIQEFDKLVQHFQAGEGDGGVTLEAFDVYFRLRRLYHVVYRLKADLYDRNDYAPDYKPDQNKRNLWRALNRQIELFETICYWLEYAVDCLPIAWTDAAGSVRNAESIWRDITRTMRWMIDAGQIPAALGDAYSAPELQHPHELFDQDAIGRVHRSLSERWMQLSAQPEVQLAGGFHSLLVWIDEFTVKTFRAYGHDHGEFWDEYDQFISLDSVVYPLEAIGDIHAKDVLETVRFSPLDAQRGFSHRNLDEKLSGDSFAHFGGFFKRSWRSNDILWGRLDGLCQLIELLFSRQRVASIVNAPHRRNAIRAALGIDNSRSEQQLLEVLKEAFPTAGDSSIQRIHDWLQNLYSADDAKRQSAVAVYDEHLELLISMAQVDIIQEGLPQVVQDAIVEQNEWNAFRAAAKPNFTKAEKIVAKSLRLAAAGQKPNPREMAEALVSALGPNLNLVYEYLKRCELSPELTPAEQLDVVKEAIGKTLPRYDASSGGFIAAGSKIDSLVMTVAAQHYAAAELKHLEPTRESAEPLYTKIGQFFTTSYRVGSESIVDDIPKVILLELFCKSFLVLKNCVLGSFPNARGRIEKNQIFYWIFDAPPRILLAISIMLRQDSAVTIAIKSAATVLSLAALVVGVIFWNPLIYNPQTPGSPFHAKWLFGLILAPLVALWLLWLSQIRRVFGWALVFAASAAALFQLSQLMQAPSYFGFHAAGIALQFAGDSGRAGELVRALPNPQAMLAFDNYVTIPLYLLAFSSFGIWVFLRRSVKLHWVGAIVCGLGIAAAGADFIENHFIASLIANLDNAAASAANITTASAIKWSSLSLALLFTAATGIGIAFSSASWKARLAPLLMAAVAAVAGFTGWWAVNRLSPLIEWSLLGLIITLGLIGLTMADDRDMEEP